MTTSDPVVSNSSPLIALERIGHVELMHALFGERLVIPPAVACEVFGDTIPPAWIEVVPITAPLDAISSPTLGAGEREAIALAIERHAVVVRVVLWLRQQLPRSFIAAGKHTSLLNSLHPDPWKQR